MNLIIVSEWSCCNGRRVMGTTDKYDFFLTSNYANPKDYECNINYDNLKKILCFPNMCKHLTKIKLTKIKKKSKSVKNISWDGNTSLPPLII